MNYKYLIPAFLTLISAALPVAANRQIIDSLKQEAQTAIRQNAGKETMVELYQQLNAWYEGIDDDSASYYLDKAFAYYPEPDYSDLGYLYLMSGKASRAFSLGNLTEAKDLYQTVHRHAVLLKEPQYDLESNSLSSIGLCYRRLGQRDSAVYYYSQAISLGKEYNDKTCLAILYFNIGVMNHNDKLFQKAFENGRLSEEYARQVKDVALEVASYSLQGTALYNMGQQEQGRNVLKQGIALGESQQAPELVMKCLSPLINTYLEDKDNDSIHYYLKLGEHYVKELPPGNPAVLGFYDSEASAYHKLGMYQRSIDVLKNTPGLTTQIPYNKYHELLARNYQKLNNYPKAYEHLRKTCNYQDSVFNSQTIKQISELQAKLNLNEKELEIARLETQTALHEQTLLKQAILFILIILILLVSLAVMLYKRRMQRKEVELVAARQYIDGLENERKRLAKDLHDGICNDLLGLILSVQQAESTPEEKEQAVRQMENIRTSIRHISHELMPPSFQFANLDEILNDYVYKTQRTVQIPVEYESNDTDDWNCIPNDIAYEIYRIVQENLNNILKHADAHYIRITNRLEDMQLTMVIENDCCSPEKTPEGIGHRTLDDRLKSIHATCEQQTDGDIHRLTVRVHI